MEDLTGSKLGDYNILEPIGQGGMATVYRAIQPSIGRDVAIKVVMRHLSHEPGFTERFYREVDIIARMQHPHILPIHDFGEDNGTAFIVMAYLTGGTLTALIDRGPMDLEPTVSLMRQIAGALDYAHKRGVIHRDVKPGNILLDEQGNVYLADFGLAKMAEAGNHLTGSGVIGTPAYMAPEVGAPDPLTYRIDIYALGVMLYEMLTGSLPYVTDNPVGQLIAHATRPIPDIREYRPDLPESLQEIIEQVLAKSPQDRYASAGAMVDDLSAVIGGSGGSTEAEATTGLLFTDINGNIIFVDGTFLKMTRRSSSHARALMGRPAYEVLEVNPGVIQQMIKEVSQIGNIRDQELTIKDVTGESVDMVLSATATYNERGNCIGADFSLRYALTVGQTDQAISSPSSIFDTHQRENLAVYVAAQIDALRVLLIRTAGQKIGDRLEDILNETAENNGWNVRISNSQLQMDDWDIRSDVYRGLISKAINYAVSVIGRKLVIKQINAVNDQLGERGRELEYELGLIEILGG